MFALATIFACLSILGGLRILYLLRNKELRDSLWLSFLEDDFKNIFNKFETRPFAIWLLITSVFLLIWFFISYRLGIIDFRSIFRSIFELRIVGF
jgi:hypothetical protein